MPLEYGTEQTVVAAVRTRKVVATRITINLPHHRSAGSSEGQLVDDENGVAPGDPGYIETFGPAQTWNALDAVEPANETRTIRVEYQDESGATYGATLTLGEALEAGLDVAGLNTALKVAIYDDVFVAKAKLPLGGQVV